MHEADVVKMETSTHINEIWEEPMPVRHADVCSRFESLLRAGQQILFKEASCYGLFKHTEFPI